MVYRIFFPFFFFFFFFATPHSLQDLRSLTKDWTRALSSESAKS